MSKPFVSYLALMLSAGIAGCDQSAGEHREVAVEHAEPAKEELEVPDWLEWHHDMSADVWLMKHEQQLQIEGIVAAERSSYDQVLDKLAPRFRENRRMLANRTVDLQTQLADNGINETTLKLLQGMATLPIDVEAASYGRQCRLYRRARLQGQSHEQALAQLLGYLE